MKRFRHYLQYSDWRGTLWAFTLLVTGFAMVVITVLDALGVWT